MNSKRFFFVMLAAVGLLSLLFVGGAYQAYGMLQKESDELKSLKLDSAVLDEQQVDLDQAKRDIQEFAELEAITKSIIPQDKDQANTIAEIATNAQQAGIRLGAIEFPQSELGQVARGKKSTANNDNSRTQLLELEDLKGVYVMDINIRNNAEAPVSYNQIIDFLKRLESNRRTAQVVDISIQPDAEVPGGFHFTIKLNTYIRPAS